MGNIIESYSDVVIWTISTIVSFALIALNYMLYTGIVNSYLDSILYR